MCNTVIANSTATFTLYKNKTKRLKLFLQPAETSLYFSAKRKKNNIIPDVPAIHHPIIGFMGSFYEWKVDLDLYESLLSKFPHFSFVCIGDLRVSYDWKQRLQNYPNFYYLGTKQRNRLPYFVEQFDVCIVPYSKEKAPYSFPTKIYEYLALGKAVVTTSLPSIKFLKEQKLIYWTNTREQFIDSVHLAVSEIKTFHVIKDRINVAKRNGWNYRIKEYLKIIDAFLS